MDFCAPSRERRKPKKNKREEGRKRKTFKGVSLPRVPFVPFTSPHPLGGRGGGVVRNGTGICVAPGRSATPPPGISRARHRVVVSVHPASLLLGAAPPSAHASSRPPESRESRLRRGGTRVGSTLPHGSTAHRVDSTETRTLGTLHLPRKNRRIIALSIRYDLNFFFFSVIDKKIYSFFLRESYKTVGHAMQICRKEFLLRMIKHALEIIV